MKKFFTKYWLIIIWEIYGLIIGLFLKFSVYAVGYNKGLNRGYNIALDTVNSIMKQQLRSDTTHYTHLTIDTSYFILKYKYIK